LFLSGLLLREEVFPDPKNKGLFAARDVEPGWKGVVYLIREFGPGRFLNVCGHRSIPLISLADGWLFRKSKKKVIRECRGFALGVSIVKIANKIKEKIDRAGVASGAEQWSRTLVLIVLARVKWMYIPYHLPPRTDVQGDR